MTVQVVLDELDRVGCVVELAQSNASALAATGLVEVRPEVGGHWRLLPSGKVGAVRVDGLQVQVNPKDKVGLTRLLFLLGYVRDLRFRPEDVEAAEEPDLWPALAESLARLVERATGRGVLQGYRTVEESARTVRGRIRIGDQIRRRPGRMIPIEVTYDEFTVDIAENQVLRTALRRMLAVPGLSTQARSRLAHLDGRLQEVSVLGPGAPIPSWRATRLNEHYHAALRLGELVLAHCSAEAGSGSVQVAAFVVDMARVFEDFVGIALAESLRRYPGTTRTQPQYGTHLDEPGPGHKAAIWMKLDVTHLVRGRPVLIFDAKYKASDPYGSYPNADRYQMLAYCTALSVPTAWLVYAAGNQPPQRRRIRHTDIEIIEYPLDLTAAPRDLLAQVDRLAQRAWNRSLARSSLAS
jgi:5-methylcytosine-specific restriction enzyme subunit McrC